MIFINISLNIIIPIFLIIGIGFYIDRKFNMDMQTLSRLNFYVFVPALVFIKILESNIQFSEMFVIILFSLIHFIVLYVLSILIYSTRYLAEKKLVLTMGTLFYNAGNYGIPLMMLTFGSDAVSIIAIIIIIQNLLCFTVGVSLHSMNKNIKGVINNFIKIPVIYAIIIGFIMRILQVDLVHQLKVPLTYLANGLISIALLTLGAQLSKSKISIKKDIKAISSVLIMRLVVSPLIASLIVPFFMFNGDISSTLILAAGLPIAVNVYIIASEYKNDENLASQIIFWSTLMSAFSLPIILTLIKIFN